MATHDVPDEMLACQVVEFTKPYAIRHVPVPKDKLTEHDLLIKVAVASLCHTDFMVMNGDFGTQLPITGSHEGAGVVVAVGSAVKDFKSGDKVMAGIGFHGCGKCPDCKGPDKQYCGQNSHTGIIGTDGFFAEYAVIDSRSTNKMPPSVKFETAAPMACAGRTVFKGIKMSEGRKGDWIAIVGSGGGLGHIGVQFAKKLGMNVIGVDARDEGLKLTKEFGADLVVDARKGIDAVVEEVKKATGGEGAKSTVNLSDAGSAAATAAAITKMHGTVIQIAQPARVDVPFQEIVLRDIKFHGSMLCNPDEAAEMLEVVAKHGVKVSTESVEGLEQVPTIVQKVHNGTLSGKGIVIVDQSLVDNQ